MKVLGLDGKEYRLALNGRVVSDNSRPRSSGHLLCRQLLRELFPFDPPCEEVTLPGFGASPLYLDFLLPARKLALEVQGSQHRTYNKMMHGSPAGFAKSKARDARKAEFCRLNGITLLVLHDDRTDGWRGTIQSAFLANPDQRQP